MEIRHIPNPGGPTLGYTSVPLIRIGELTFKDPEGKGELLPYEDWRLDPKTRAEDLAKRLSVEEIAGLMLYSAHQAVPNRTSGHFGKSTYNGKPYDESGAAPWDLTDQQREFLSRDHVRHVLATTFESPEVAARWNNEMQAFAEQGRFAIPVNTSSDPRHGSDFSAEYNMGAGREISLWPETLGLAATFDPEVTRQFGEIASKEYRALGIATALSPQVDLATDPRWSRFMGTFGEGVKLSTDMARAYCDGFQTTKNEDGTGSGWGRDSVNTMVKHWPGGGSGEGGRDAHYAYGKYAVYPGNNLETTMKPFTEGAFRLEGGTERASAVMPYYTVSVTENGSEGVGNAYSKHMIGDQLRRRFGYDGVVCTDWGVLKDMGKKVTDFAGKCWGFEDKTSAEKHYAVLEAGCDQFGGDNEAGPVLEAYELGVKEHGEAYMRARFEQSAVRLLLNFFRTGLFEDPYVDVEQTRKIVACPEFREAGLEAQRRSLVLLKNKGNVLPLKKGIKVYVPKSYRPASRNFFGQLMPETHEWPIDPEEVGKYFTLTEDPKEADAALCCISYANGGQGYSEEDKAAGGNGYMPISLQYRPYTATTAREHSLAGGDPLEEGTDRSYRGKTVTTVNESDLDMVLSAREAMGDKPVITVIRMSRPCVSSEFEPSTDAVLLHSGVGSRAILETLCGENEPSGLLPMQIPANMETVEKQFEDLQLDMECHRDTEGHLWDFAYGMNWSGPIDDERVRRYKE